MPGIVPSRRSHSSMEDGGNNSDNGSAASQDSDVDTPNKRARLDSRRTTNDSWRLDTPRTISKPNGQSMRSESRPQEHQPGAIIRVTLINFVTYANATFYPGASLNMVIGPNGTGKSTLVCAICLGLGWGPKHLGRAKNVEDFIKHGAKEATIEIELKGKPGKSNRIIKRTMAHDKRHNGWWINGKSGNEKSARKTAESFNIQIDNLCQFLPQDRVVEFANMKPTEKLRATIRAAGSAEMIEQHEELIGLRVRQREAETEVVGHKTQLAALEAKQNSQQQDVERVRERQQVQEEIDFLEKTKPAAEYADAVTVFKEAVDVLVAHQKLQAEKEQEVTPSTNAVHRKEDYQIAVQKTMKSREVLRDGLEKSLDVTVKRINTIATKLQDIDQKRAAEKKQADKRSQNIAAIKNAIQRLERELKNAPPEFDAADYNERIREKGRAVVADEEKIQTERDELSSHKLQKDQRRQKISTAEAQISRLSSLGGQREALLTGTNIPAATAWRYIQENKAELERTFDGPIYGPAIIECSVKDPAWAGAIEALFQPSDLAAFTVTTFADLERLSNLLHKPRPGGGPAIAVNASLRQTDKPLSAYPPPLDSEGMRNLGISGWALDLMDGPEAVLSMLCGKSRANCIALLDREESEEQYDRLSNSNAVDNWTTKQKSTKITRRREYDAMSVRTSATRPGRYWVSQPVDHAAIDRLRRDISEMHDEIETLTTQTSAAMAKMETLKRSKQTLIDEQKELRDEKDSLQKARSHIMALPKRIENEKARLQAEQDADAARAETLAELGASEASLSVEKAQLVINYSNSVCALQAAHADFLEACINNIEALNDVKVLKARNAENERMIATLQGQQDKLLATRNEKKAEARAAKATMLNLFKKEPHLEERILALPDDERHRTVAEIDAAMQGLDARLELLHGGHGDIVKEYEERATKIEKMQTVMAERNDNLAQISDEITQLRSLWEGSLDALVGQISTAFGGFFARIKCAGEVSVHKAGEEGKDFENWEVMLMVKFREEEGLSVLDAHRQSGGERAVSTMFYLMALQSLSQAPFRVVDEINQGMDPRNERCVHEMMVDVACGTLEDIDDGGDEDGGEVIVPRAGNGGSQYFLITPKLLTGLKYGEGMKVHIINSGALMPKDPETLDVKKLIAARMAFKQAAGRGVSVGA